MKPYQVIFFVLLVSHFGIWAQEGINYPKSLANFQDFRNLVNQVESHRNERLLDFDEFLKMSQEENVIVLDARSAYRYQRKHFKGAIHLNFSEFTQEELNALIPDTNATILIYCNNNFVGDSIDFQSKVYTPKLAETSNRLETQLESQKSILLALNIPTYINLYGYGYKNVYELNELVNINDPRIQFEGTEITF